MGRGGAASAERGAGRWGRTGRGVARLRAAMRCRGPGPVHGHRAAGAGLAAGGRAGAALQQAAADLPDACKVAAGSVRGPGAAVPPERCVWAG